MSLVCPHTVVCGHFPERSAVAEHEASMISARTKAASRLQQSVGWRLENALNDRWREDGQRR